MEKNCIAGTPPMGWNSWNTFYDKISADLVCSTADAMVDKGYLEAGYQYLIIDDCWAQKERDSYGQLVPDPEKFPEGIRPVADYIHEKGLKLGMYADCGVRTCADYPGSFEHEFEDARQFAAWGVDYLKYDNGYRPGTLSTPLLYRRMSLALKNSGRDILLAACQWGTDEVHSWIRSSGAHTFRSTIDITDSWDSIKNIALSQLGKQHCTAPHCFNDMDMLVVGMYGKGMNPETSLAGGRAGCTDTEYETHFALWAMMGSPLIMGCDIRSASEKAREILQNKDIISMNQDPECRSCSQIPAYANEDAFILSKPLRDGSLALGFFNFGESEAKVSLPFWDLGLPAASGMGLDLYDCLSHEEAGFYREIFSPKVAPHGCRVYRARLAEK